jgi:hypothetical protein
MFLVILSQACILVEMENDGVPVDGSMIKTKANHFTA